MIRKKESQYKQINYATNAWYKYLNMPNGVKTVFDFAEKYKTFLTNSKTERLCAEEVEKILIANGFKKLRDVKKLKKGDKIYDINKHKNVAAFVIGSKPIEEGMKILGAHIDSPRLDLKQSPLYEKDEFVLLDTHYYGGIKKYQWLTVPLALVGVVCLKNGKTVKIDIGNKKDDPVFGVNDLLIHLSSEKQSPVSGEKLDITFGAMPIKEGDKKNVQNNVLKILKDTYGIESEDFISAEIEAVPAMETRDFGIDRSMIEGYGHDDRCCAYPSIMGIVNCKNPTYTSCVILTDKEEIGSVGATGAHSFYIENVVMNIALKLGNNHPVLIAREALANSQMISSDVTSANDPLFTEVSCPHNMSKMNYGICISKFTGHRGKSGSNDANPEFIAYLRKFLDESGINYQTGELGAVDIGGGGTIAYILAKYNMDVIDAGVPVLNMHSTMEVISKVDLYEAYLFYKAFLETK